MSHIFGAGRWYSYKNRFSEIFKKKTKVQTSFVDSIRPDKYLLPKRERGSFQEYLGK